MSHHNSNPNPNIIGHIVGIDDIHKKKFIKELPLNVKAIDLDAIQQSIYNHRDIIKQKLIWGHLSSELVRMKKLKNKSGSKRKKLPTLKIKKYLQRRAKVKRKIHQIWKQMMGNHIRSQLTSEPILFIGHNMFPKDYRIKVDLNIPVLPKLDLDNLNMKRININSPNLIIYQMKPEIYAANQIKFYLNTYSNKIIKGTFPINLLQTTYLSNKYQKVLDYYAKQNYQIVQTGDISKVISNLASNNDLIQYALNRSLYAVTLYKTNGIIPINQRTPLQVFSTKSDAVAFMRSYIKNKLRPVYIHKIKSQPITIIDHKMYITGGVVYPIEEESVLLT